MTEFSPKSTLIAYCTDVEGNWDYWNRYIALSKALNRNEGGRLSLNDNFCFVYGGDVCDRGPGDLRLLNDLNNLNDDYPGRVYFIFGNRDVNKMRIPMELHHTHLLRAGEVYWTSAKSDAGESAVDRLKYILTKTMASPSGFKYRQEELRILGKPHTDEDVVKSYLEQIDGPKSPLMRYLLHAVVAVHFGDVLFCHGGINSSNLSWLPPRSPHLQCQGSQQSSVFLTPGPSGGELCNNIHDWIEEANRRAKEELYDFMNRGQEYRHSLTTAYEPHWGAVGNYEHKQPGSRLGYLGMAMIAGPGPMSAVNPSIIYASYIRDGMPANIDPSVTRALQAAGVNRIVVGHQPHGDAPTTIQQHGMQIFMGDTSYSAGTLWSGGGPPTDSKMPQAAHRPQCDDWHKYEPHELSSSELGLLSSPIDVDNTRGVTVSEILVEVPSIDAAWGVRSAIHMHGILSDGSVYDFTVPEASSNSSYIGMMNASKTWMVKAHNVRVRNGPFKGRCDMYLLSRGEGYTFKNKFVSPENIEEEMMT